MGSQAYVISCERTPRARLFRTDRPAGLRTSAVLTPNGSTTLEGCASAVTRGEAKALRLFIFAVGFLLLLHAKLMKPLVEYRGSGGGSGGDGCGGGVGHLVQLLLVPHQERVLG